MSKGLNEWVNNYDRGGDDVLPVTIIINEDSRTAHHRARAVMAE